MLLAVPARVWSIPPGLYMLLTSLAHATCSASGNSNILSRGAPQRPISALVCMHVAGKHGIHAMLKQAGLHGLRHVIHLMLVRLVAVVPVRDRCGPFSKMPKGHVTCSSPPLNAQLHPTIQWIAAQRMLQSLYQQRWLGNHTEDKAQLVAPSLPCAAIRAREYPRGWQGGGIRISSLLLLLYYPHIVTCNCIMNIFGK